MRHSVPPSPVYRPIAIFQTDQFFPKQSSADVPPSGDMPSHENEPDSGRSVSAAAASVEKCDAIYSPAAEVELSFKSSDLDTDSVSVDAAKSEFAETGHFINAVSESDVERGPNVQS